MNSKIPRVALRMATRGILRFGGFLVFQHGSHGAMQNEAQIIQRLCGNGLAILHAMYRVRRQPVAVYQVIGGHIFFVQRAPKRLIGNHADNPSI